MATNGPPAWHYDFDSDSEEHEGEDEDDEPHYVHGSPQNGVPSDEHNEYNQSNSTEGDADDELEVQDVDLLAHKDKYPSGGGSDGELSDEDESDISSIPDDDSSGDAGVSLLDELTDDEMRPDISFQELQQRLNEMKRELRDRTERIEVLEQELNKSHERESALKREKQTLEADKKRLKNQLDGIREPPVHWRQQLARGLPRDEVWRAFAHQNNMSQHRENRHPALNWGRLENGERDDPGYESADSDTLADKGEAPEHSQESTGSEAEPKGSEFVFEFDMLPLIVQERVFRYLFVKTELIHCISRFDLTGNDGTVFHRFHVGPSDCSIRRAHRPASILKYFLVSKRWLFMGVSCFFSQNTFAFSSLGEFGSFMAWLPRARRERIQHIEIFWQGSIMPRHETRINQRTLPLTYLCKTPRLRTLVVHIQESEKRTRRRHEMLDGDELNDLVNNDIFDVDEVEQGKPYLLDPHSVNPYKIMKRTTGAQPNFRANRSIRTCHGMDYVYQLRGMRWIRFKQLDRKGRQNIRDWSFVEDLNSVVTMPKVPRDASRSELENLYPISVLGDFNVTDADWEIVYRWYGQAPPASVLGDTQGAPSIPASEPEASTVLGLFSEDDSDRNDGSDDSDGGDNSDSNNGSDGGDDDDGRDGDSAVADLDGIGEVEMEGSPGHGSDISASYPRSFVDLTLDSEDEGPGPEPAQPHSPQSFSLSSDKASDARSRSESLFVRSDNDSEKGSRSESLFVRSDSASSGGAKTEDPGDGAQQKRFVIDLTTIDEETEPSSHHTAGLSKQGILPTKGGGQPWDGFLASSKRERSLNLPADEPDPKRRRTRSVF